MVLSLYIFSNYLHILTTHYITELETQRKPMYRLRYGNILIYFSRETNQLLKILYIQGSILLGKVYRPEGSNLVLTHEYGHYGIPIFSEDRR
jgi:hypothetical protein